MLESKDKDVFCELHESVPTSRGANCIWIHVRNPGSIETIVLEVRVDDGHGKVQQAADAETCIVSGLSKHVRVRAWIVHKTGDSCDHEKRRFELGALSQILAKSKRNC